MSKLGPKDAKQRYEIPSEMSVHDFVRRAVAEARLIIAEIDKTPAENWHSPTSCSACAAPLKRGINVAP
jgi:hypothetical protein